MRTSTLFVSFFRFLKRCCREATLSKARFSPYAGNQFLLTAHMSLRQRIAGAVLGIVTGYLLGHGWLNKAYLGTHRCSRCQRGDLLSSGFSSLTNALSSSFPAAVISVTNLTAM